MQHTKHPTMYYFHKLRYNVINNFYDSIYECSRNFIPKKEIHKLLRHYILLLFLITFVATFVIILRAHSRSLHFTTFSFPKKIKSLNLKLNEVT